ncbi:uncharacterized protein CDAR_528201 [Caerostris darwini]|uniref:Sushi domain-containing protein n=1 Tax=Caerostris darwini TaxID=1538125 RepID=A0AAV4SUF7_9ARAC|nr:uncharacterized protein CDAR_528201 [Caerostris darwini]
MESRWLECGYPGAPAFGRPHPVKELYRPGDAVSFTCAHGHSLQGALQRVCLLNGTWAGQLPLCDRSLSSVDQQASSRQTLSLYSPENAIDGDPRTCTYTDKLRPRWIRVDMRKNQRVKAVAITVPEGIYSQDPAQLTIYAISVRDSTTASYHKCASFNGRFATATLQLACAGGEVEGRYIHVEDSRNRIDYFSLCEIQVFVNRGSYECGEAERPAHAYSVRTETGAVNYRCVYGYRLEGPSTRLCQQNGQWSHPQPICREILCPAVREIPHGRLHYLGRKTDQLTLGTLVNVSCDYGYQVSGSPLLCEESGAWSKGNLSCQPIDCGMPPVGHESEQYVLLNGTNYGAVALLRCGEGEAALVCREDGTWSAPELDCAQQIGLSRLGLIEEDQADVPTGIVIGMAVVVFILLVTVVLVLLLKRRKVLRQNSTDSLPSKETSSTLTPNSPQPYENDAFYATIPVEAISNPTDGKRNFMSTVLFPRRKRQAADALSKRSDDTTKDSGNSSVSNGCIYEEIGAKPEGHRTCEDTATVPVAGEAVYAQVDLEEKRRSRMVKTLCERFEPVDPPEWEEGTYRAEEAYDEVDLEPIKLRELPPIPDENGSGVTYASLALPLDPPPHTLTKNNEIYEDSGDTVSAVMKDNELYLTLKV